MSKFLDKRGKKRRSSLQNGVQVRHELQPTVQVSPNRLGLGKLGNGGVHETEDVESHLLSRKGANAELLEFLSDDVVYFQGRTEGEERRAV